MIHNLLQAMQVMLIRAIKVVEVEVKSMMQHLTLYTANI